MLFPNDFGEDLSLLTTKLADTYSVVGSQHALIMTSELQVKDQNYRIIKSIDGVGLHDDTNSSSTSMGGRSLQSGLVTRKILSVIRLKM